jgi:hypothetical protein
VIGVNAAVMRLPPVGDGVSCAPGEYSRRHPMSRGLQAFLPFATVVICLGLMLLTLTQRFRKNTLTARAFAVIFAVGHTLMLSTSLSVYFAVSRVRLRTDLLIFMVSLSLLNLIGAYPIAYFIYKFFGRRLLECLSSAFKRVGDENTSENV